MANLIDCGVLIADIRQQGILGSGYSDSERENDIVDMIESQNIVDAVPVVRCKDCKYCWYQHFEGFTDDNDTYNYDICECEFWYAKYNPEQTCIHRIDVEPDDFCSYGKRKEQG